MRARRYPIVASTPSTLVLAALFGAVGCSSQDDSSAGDDEASFDSGALADSAVHLDAAEDASGDSSRVLDSTTAGDSHPGDAVVDSTLPTSDAATCAPLPTHSGGLTQYDRTTLGNCGQPWPADDLFAAMSTPDFNAPFGPDSSCGKCVEITGPTGLKVLVHAVDQCPTAGNPLCIAGHIDLSHTAFKAIVPSTYMYGGEVPNDHPISWRYAPCPVTGPIVYHFKDGTNPGWIAVQIRNARHGIKTIRYRAKSGSWIDLTPPTGPLAYFVVAGLGTSTIDLEAIDEFDHLLEDDGLAATADTDVNGKAQFPTCP